VTVKFAELSDRIQGQVIDTGAGFPSELWDGSLKNLNRSGNAGGTV